MTRLPRARAVVGRWLRARADRIDREPAPATEDEHGRVPHPKAPGGAVLPCPGAERARIYAEAEHRAGDAPPVLRVYCNHADHEHVVIHGGAR